MTDHRVIRRELRRLGWQPDPLGDLTKGRAVLTGGPGGSLGLVGPTYQGRREAALWFPPAVPSAVVVAACEAWAADPATATTGRPADPTTDPT